MLLQQKKRATRALGVVLVMLGLLGLASISWAQWDTWTQKADMPTGRHGLASGVVGGRIYAIGGRLSDGSASSAVEQYDPVADTWTTRTPMPTSRMILATGAVNGKIYAIGGVVQAYAYALSTVEEYDPGTDAWTRKAPMPTARLGLATSVVDGKIYAIGGMRSGVEFWSGIRRTVEAYDPPTDTWSEKADMPTPRVWFSTSVVDGRIYAIGGALVDQTMLSTVEAYDPATDTWTQRAPMPTARFCLATAVVDGIIYAIGGGTHTAAPGGFSVVEAYDPATDTWMRKADLPTRRSNLCASVVGGRIYAIGGLASAADPHRPGFPTVYEYVPGPWPSSVVWAVTAATAEQPIALEVTAVLDEPWASTGIFPQMTLDLSALGISPAFPCQHEGAGQYTASTTVTPLQSGRYYLPLMVEATEGGDWYRLFHLRVDVHPVGDLTIYDDAPSEGWTVTALRGEPDLESTAFVHSGSSSHAILLSEQTLVRYTFADPEGLDLFGYTHLEFWINGGEGSGQDPSVAGVKLSDVGIVPEANTWTEVTIPASELTDPLTSLPITGQEPHTFYLDDMKLAAGLPLTVVSATDRLAPTVAGRSTPVEVEVVVDVLPGVTIPFPQMHLDASSVGVTSAVPLHHHGDGCYTAMTTMEGLKNGQYCLPIIVERTDGKPYPLLTLTLDVYPAGDLILYDDAPERGWTVDVSTGQSDSASSAFVHSGSFSHEIGARSYLAYVSEEPEGISPFGYSHLEFWVNGGEGSGQDPSVAGVKLSDLGIVPEANTWTRVTISASALPDPLRSISITLVSGDPFYLDDMKLVAMEPPPLTDAVEELAEAGRAPEGYALSQNFPNPFNPVTTIAYDLPEAEDVRLDVYNVTGQKVATLVSGHHQAGRHQVAWAGKDATGRAVASGLHLYCLEAGSFLQTRRMVLLR